MAGDHNDLALRILAELDRKGFNDAHDPRLQPALIPVAEKWLFRFVELLLHSPATAAGPLASLLADVAHESRADVARLTAALAEAQSERDAAIETQGDLAAQRDDAIARAHQAEAALAAERERADRLDSMHEDETTWRKGAEAERDEAGRILGAVIVAGTLREGERLVTPLSHAAIDAIVGMVEQRDAALARAARLERVVEALHGYARHGYGCAAVSCERGGEFGPCDCGLAALSAECAAPPSAGGEGAGNG